MKISKILLSVAIAMTVFCVNGCSSGISTDELDGVSVDALKFDVANPITLSPGESVTFSVSYRNTVLELSGCSSTHGNTSSTTTACTYTAPSSRDGLSSIPDPETNILGESVIATIDHPGAATLAATLSVNIQFSSESCASYEDCGSEQICFFGSCMAWADVGIHEGSPCDDADDCSILQACAPVDSSEGCQSYCTDLLTFYDSDLNPPSTESECDAVEGAEWLMDTLCVPSDMATCMEDDGDSAYLRTLPTASITVDGATGDWAGIEAIATDATGDSLAPKTGGDIVAFYGAVDEDNLYLRMDLSENANTTFRNEGVDENAGRYSFWIKSNSDTHEGVEAGVAYSNLNWELGGNGSNSMNMPDVLDSRADLVGVSGKTIEVEIPLALIGNPTRFYIKAYTQIGGIEEWDTCSLY
ncbi:MAG TPA: hypothetical protein PKU96_06925 [bacterium]|nr:hypothetical protein [bacterium]